MRAALILSALFLAGCGAPLPGGDGGAGGSGGATFAVVCRGAFADPCVVDAGPNDSPSQTEIDLAVNPTDPRNIFVASKDLDPLATDTACVWSVGQVTMDAGATWKTVYVGGTLDERADPTHPLHGWSCVTDPILKFDADGVLYYILQISGKDTTGEPDPLVERPSLRRGAPVNAYFLAVSRDGGATFPREEIRELTRPHEQPSALVFHDYERMVVSPTTGTVLVVWTGYTAHPIPLAGALAGVPAPGSAYIVRSPYVARITDGGRAHELSTINGPDYPLRHYYFGGLAVDADGTFYASLQEGETVERIAEAETALVNVLARSDDDGLTWEILPFFDIEEISRDVENAEYRAGATEAIELVGDTSAGPHRGRVHALWSDNRSGSPDALTAWSDDRGETWSEPVAVAEGLGDQFMARPDVGDDGTYHVLLMDRSYDPAHRLLDLTHAWSADGGMAWQRQRVTSVSFDGDLGIHQSGVPFIGDYNGIDAIGDDVWMAFPTTVTGRAELVVARATR